MWETIENYPGLRYSVCKRVQIFENFTEACNGNSLQCLELLISENNIKERTKNIDPSDLIKDIKIAEICGVWKAVYDGEESSSSIFREIHLEFAEQLNFKLLTCFSSFSSALLYKSLAKNCVWLQNGKSDLKTL